MSTVQPLAATALNRKTDPGLFDFQTTEELEDLTEAIGQPRAVEAVHFGMGIHQGGYNIFALGPVGVGKRSLIRQFFEKRAASEPVPSDWCYVHNFSELNKPRAIQLPPGRGEVFRHDMETLVEELRTALAAAFDSDEYRARKQAIEQEFQESQEKSFEALQQHAREQNFALLRTPGGLVFAPIRNGEVISPEEFQKLAEEDRKQLESQMGGLQEELQKVLQQIPTIQREYRKRIVELNRGIITFAVGDLISELGVKYQDTQAVVDYLNDVKEDVLANAEDFLPQEEEQSSNPQNIMAFLMARARAGQAASLQRFKVNLLVNHSKTQGAPVVFEDNPTYQNLIGQFEHMAQMGALMTDFTLIKPGSLHLANGGYLILDIRKVLQQPFVWDALKRALQSNQIRIESLGQMLSLISTISLEPEPIPLNVKVALFGDRMLYYMLSELDPEFSEMFKVQADFEEQMERDDENQILYAQLVATLARKYKLRPFDRGAVARLIEYSARLAGDAQKLSIQVRNIADLLREADYWANEKGDGAVTASDVQNAIDKQIYRADRIRDREQETILRGIYLIDTQGEKVGQVNGLSVVQLGNFAFGRPSRITARVWLGKGEVVDIEREVELGGPIHSKGVMILRGFLGARYAHQEPLSFSASLVFEQSYSGVEGDSASSAELFALLSALSEAPIKQSLAVTGSVNQHGQIQAIGGVNEKIEGFFDICQTRGLTGEQGVIIPASNVVHLMLRQDVVTAVEADQFQIYPIYTVDEGIELLTGILAGEPDEKGNFPTDSINGRVMAKLAELTKVSAELSASSKEAKKNE